MGCWRNPHSVELIYPHHYSRSRDMTQFWIFINHFLEPVLWNKSIHSCWLSVMNIFQPVSSWMAIIFQRETDPDIYMLQRQTVAKQRRNQTHKCSSWRLEKHMSRHISHSRKHTPATCWDNSRYRLFIPGSNYHTGCNRCNNWEGWRESTTSFNFYCMISVSDSHESTSFFYSSIFLNSSMSERALLRNWGKRMQMFYSWEGRYHELGTSLGHPCFLE